MKINEHTALLTPRVLLVPYSAHHVPTYHAWMQDKEIQRATASEPLTLDEEYAMQRSWRLDADKLTFIVCAAPSLSPSDTPHAVTPQEHDAPDCMLGDVNLFLYADDEDEDEGKGEGALVGELEIMLAHPDARGKGLARETLRAFMCYITSSLPDILAEYGNARVLRYLRVKIDKGNGRSLGLFEGLGFTGTGAGPNYFGEVEMRAGVVEGRLVGVEARVGLEEIAREVRYGEA